MSLRYHSNDSSLLPSKPNVGSRSVVCGSGQYDHSKSTLNIVPSIAPMTVAPLVVPEFGVDEVVGDETIVGGETEIGREADGKNEDVALQNHNRFSTYFLGWAASRQDSYLAFATVSVIDSMSSCVGKSPCKNVTPRVVVCVSGMFTATMRPIEVLTSVVIETSVGSAVKVKLMVAFEKEVVRRYRAEADYGCQSLTGRLSGQITSKIEEHLWYDVACLWYRTIGVDYCSPGCSVVR